MTENRKKKYTFRYQLTYEEAYNAFLALAVRWKKKTKYAVMTAMVAVTVAIMTMFALHPDRYYYFTIVIFAVILTSYVFYSPMLKARKGAKQVAKIDGIYEIKLTNDGKIIMGNSSQELDLKGDKNSRALELKDSFAIRMNGDITVCIPKRVMNESQQNAVRKILADNIKFIVYDQ